MSDILIISLIIGLLYSFFTIGLTISFRILNYPDLTIDGSLILGGASFYFFNSLGIGLYISLFFSLLLGFVAGFFTSFLNTHFNINKLITGIITSALLYSINIRLLGGLSNVRFTNSNLLLNNSNDLTTIITLIAIISILLIVLILLFHSKLGYYFRIIGDNPFFLESLGKNKKIIQNIGIGISNAIIALGGAILVQYKGVCDVNYSTGILISSLAAILLGDMFLNAKNINEVFISNILGTIFYSFVIALIMFNWSDTWQNYILGTDIRFFSGLLLLIPLIITSRNKKKFKFFKSDW
ncbi:MAG: hypothetical protein GXO49_01765 [Chlorobi bacterium]|nr:hypothetical protein [Chlorobiota bacterium]